MEAGFGKEQHAWEGTHAFSPSQGLLIFFTNISFSNTFLVFRKTILASHLRYKKGIILVADAVSVNDFLLETKNLSMKGVFLTDRVFTFSYLVSPVPSLKKFGKCW